MATSVSSSLFKCPVEWISPGKVQRGEERGENNSLPIHTVLAVISKMWECSTSYPQEMFSLWNEIESKSHNS